MDPKDLRKQLEKTVNPVVDQRLEGKAPSAAAQPPDPAEPPQGPADVAPQAPAPQTTQTPAAVAPSAPAAGAQPSRRGKIIYVDDLKDVPQGEIAVWGANMNNYNTGTATPGAGQAEAAAGRGDWIGIPTKRTPGTFLSDADLKDPQFSQLMDSQLKKIEAALASGKDIYFPSQGIGTGRAKLEEKAPQVFRKLFERLQDLGIRNSGEGYAPVVGPDGELGPETVDSYELADSLARSKGIETERLTKRAPSPVSEMSSFGTTDPVDAERNPTLSTELAQRATSPVSEQGGLPVPPQGETPVSVAPRAISGESTIRRTISFEESRATGYRERTIENVRSADITIQFAVDYNSAGERLTSKTVTELGKPSVRVDMNKPIDYAAIARRVAEIAGGRPISINVAGNGIYTVQGKFSQQEFDSILEKALAEILKSTKITEVRSGGQTGADEAGVKAAAKLGIKAKVLAPKGYKFRNIEGTDVADESAFKARFNTEPAPAPEKITTAATPDLEASLQATRTGELRAAPSDETVQRVAAMSRMEREQSILGYDPIADLESGFGSKSKLRQETERRMLTDIIDMMKQDGTYTTTRAEQIVGAIKNGQFLFDEETNTFEVVSGSQLDEKLADIKKLHAQSMTEFLAKPHGLERKVYKIYLDKIFGKEIKPGKKVSASDIDADGATIERGQKAIRRLGLHFLMNYIGPERMGEWADLREEFRAALVEAGVSEEVFDSAMRENLWGNRDARSVRNDSATVQKYVETLRRSAGELLREGTLYDVARHPSVAQPLYYLLNQIVQADAEITSGEMAGMNPFVEEDFIRAEAADLTEVQEDIDKIRADFDIEEGYNNRVGGNKGRSKEGTVGQEFTLNDIRLYKSGGQRRYVLDVAGVVDPRWVEVDERGLDLEIFANENYPEGTSTKASIGFNISTDPTAKIYTGDQTGERVSTLEIRVTKAAKQFIQERDSGERLRPTTSDKTIRLAAEIPYTQDSFRVFKTAEKLRDAFSLGRVVLVAFPQFDGSKRIERNPDEKINFQGREFPISSEEMFMLEEGDPAIARLVEAGATTSRPFRFGEPVVYPRGQTQPGQFDQFVIDVDPIVHQAVQHSLPLKSVGGYEFQGAYIPEPFADEFEPGRPKQAIAEQVPGVRQTQEGITRTPVATTELIPSPDQEPGMAEEMLPQEVVTQRITAARSPEVRTLVVADDRGNFPTVGTMIDGYVYGDPYGEDPRMYAEIADRVGPSMKSLVSQRRRYEELIEAGTRSSEVPLEDMEKNTLLEGELSRQGRSVGGYRDVGIEAERKKNYDKFLEDKTYVDANPSDLAARKAFDEKYKDTTWYKGIQEGSKTYSVVDEITGAKPEGQKVAVYDATDVYDAVAKKPRKRKDTARIRGTIGELPPPIMEDLSPRHRQLADDMIRSLLVILRHRAQTANFINFGDQSGPMQTIKTTSENLLKLFENLDKNGLYNGYFESILANDVFASRLGLDNPDSTVWLQRLVELPGQRPLSTRGRDTDRYLPKFELSGDDESDKFNDAVDQIYRAIADFNAENPARVKGDVSYEAVAESLAEQLQVEGRGIEEEGTDRTFLDAEGNEVTVAEGEASEYKAFYAVRKNLPSDKKLIIDMLTDATVQDAINGDIYKIAEMPAPPAYKGGQPWGDFVMENIDDIINRVRNVGKESPGIRRTGTVSDTKAPLNTAIKNAVSRLAGLTPDDQKRAVDAAFEKYSQHLADDMDGDAMVKVINSMLYGDPTDEAIAKHIDEMTYQDITADLSLKKPVSLQGKRQRIATNEEIKAISGNEVNAKRYIAFVKRQGFDFLVVEPLPRVTDPTTGEITGGTPRIIITKVKKNKYGEIEMLPEDTFNKRNVFTAEEVTRVLDNFGALNMIRVRESGDRDGNKPLYTIDLNPDVFDHVAGIDARSVEPRTGRLATTLRNLLDSALKAQFRRIVNTEAVRAGMRPIFSAEETNPIALWEEGRKDGYFGPFGQRRVRNKGRSTYWLLRRGGLDEAERIAALAEYAERTRPGADPILDSVRGVGSAPKYEALSPELEGLSRTTRSYLRNHRLGLIGGGGLLGAIAMGVGVDAALNKAEYGDQAALEYLPTSIAMNAAFEANPLLGSALALGTSAVNKQDMARTLVNIIGSLAGGALGGTVGAFAGGPVGGFAGGTAGSMAGAGVTNALYNAVTGKTEDQYEQMPANVAADDGTRYGASSVAASTAPVVQRGGSALDQIKALEGLGG